MKNLFLILIAFITYKSSFSQSVTWSEDVACILFTHCIRCHNNTNSLAAIPFTNYNETWSNRLAIKYYVQKKLMPPYMPDTKDMRYTHEKNLTQGEIDLIVAWVEQGSKEGSSSVTPPEPMITPLVSNILKPDFSQRIPTYTIPSLVAFQYHCFVFQTTFPVEKLISDIEILPANLSSVYSAFLYADTSNVPLTLDAADPNNGYENYGGIGSQTAKLLYGWVNGNPLYHPPPNMAIRLDAKTHLILRIMYAEDALGKRDSTAVNLKFDTSGTARIVDIGTFLHQNVNLQNPPFIIPADSLKTFHEQYVVPKDITLLGVAPWGQKFCSIITCFAVTPANDTLTLFNADDHEDIWSQGFYYFSYPIKLPVGTILFSSAVYDNTSSNPNNPFFPPHNIVGGITDTTESMQFSFSYLPYLANDENILADSVLHQDHYLNCSPLHTVNIQQMEKQIFTLYPNPANQVIVIQFGNEIPFAEINILDVLGKTVLQQSTSNFSNTNVNIAHLTNGIYFIQIKSPKHFLTQKFVKL